MYFLFCHKRLEISILYVHIKLIWKYFIKHFAYSENTHYLCAY